MSGGFDVRIPPTSTFKLMIAVWCRKADAIIDRILAGATVQLSLPLGPADQGDTPARYRQDIIPCDDEPDDEDEPTEKDIASMAKAIDSMTSTTTTALRARPFGDFHAPEIPRFARPSLDPAESLERAVAEGRASRARLMRSLRVPAEVQYAKYVAAQAWIKEEKGSYAAKKGKAKAKKGAAA